MAGIIPTNYELVFEPLFHNFKFNGKEIIIVQANPHATYSPHLFVQKWGGGKYPSLTFSASECII